jgi:hypothetical protein
MWRLRDFVRLRTVSVHRFVHWSGRDRIVDFDHSWLSALAKATGTDHPRTFQFRHQHQQAAFAGQTRMSGYLGEIDWTNSGALQRYDRL